MSKRKWKGDSASETEEKEDDQPGPSSQGKFNEKEKETQTSVTDVMDSDPDGKKKRSRDSKVAVSSSDSDRWTPEEAEVYENFRSTLKNKFQHLVEGVSNQGETRHLHEIYTELYVTKRVIGGINDEHEVRRESWSESARGSPIKCSDIFKPLLDDNQPPEYVLYDYEVSDKSDHRQLKPIRSIKCSDIFKPLPGQHKPIRTVLTKGEAGIGKTVCVQKFILDWTEGETNQNVHFIFPLPFRELNLMKDKRLSLMELLQHFFPEIKDSKVFTSSEHRVMFIFDGLDECRLPLDFHSNLRCCDVSEPVSVDVLLTNLIKKNLLPSAFLWITTRPAAANQIPPKCVDQVTEIRGFNDPQKEEYFRKRISDENIASKTITHLKSSRSLYTMCHIPVFCWILATVVERASVESDTLEMPRTITQFYTYFLNIQTCIKKEKYTERKVTDEEMIFKLGKLAFQQLEKGNLIFYEEDLRECGVDITEASVYSGVCTQIFREESGLYQGKVFSFVHLTIQEFLAALYVFLCFRNRERSMSDQQQTSQLSVLFKAATLHDLHNTAVDLALQSKNGHLDLFLRFLLGLSLESSQNLLMHLLPQTRSQTQSSEQTVQYIKKKIIDGIQKGSYEIINLFYCLNELNHHAVVEMINRKLGTLSVDVLIPEEWRTRRFTFKMSKEQLDEFDLRKYIKTPGTDQTEFLSPDEVIQRLIPVVTSAQLNHWSITEKSCAVIASAARSNSSLKELDLSKNELHDAGVQHIAELLNNPDCKLEKLVLQYCSLTEKSCATIASAARSNSCSLKELDLSRNELHDAGIQHLSELIKNPHCKLETLALESCSLTEKSCAVLASAARSNSCSLKELHLSYNKLQDAGIQHLSELLKNPHCKLEKLLLQSCFLTEKSCVAIASAARLNCSLKELDLSMNELHDAGVQHLSELLKNPHCKLEKLVLWRCSLTEKSCAAIVSASRSNSCSLKELNLSDNQLQDAGIQHLSKLFKNPQCKLEKLWLYHCFLTEESCAAIASAARSNSSLKELNLLGNYLDDAGVQHLSELLKSPHCKLEKLVLWGCFLTEKSCAVIAATARSNYCSLKELALSDNELYDAGVQHLSEILKNPNCKLEKLGLSKCSLTDKSCAVIASAARSNYCCLRKLDLSDNELHDAGVQHLLDLLNNPHYKLEKLELSKGIFRTESPAVATASASSSHSDSAELHLGDKVQQDPGAQLLSLDTHMEDHRNNAPQRSCESCAEVPDSSHWVLVKPEVSTEESVSTYRLSSPAGSYECSESGLRWTCAGLITLQYRFTHWHVFAKELAQMQFGQAGPLMDIRLMSGELEEIHLPHFLCLGGTEASVCDAVRVLHGQESGVCVEVCELTRHHARLLHPSFSLLGVVYYLRDLLFPKVHCELLLFCTCTTPLELHTYLVPDDPAHIQAIHKKEMEKERRGMWIDKPSAVGPLWLKDSVYVRTSCPSEIHPKKMNLWPLSTGNFCEVYMKEPEEEFDMEVISSQHTEPIWTVKIRRRDYCQTSKSPGQGSRQGTSTERLFQVRPGLISGVSRGVLRSMLDRLQAHRPPVLSSREAEEVLQRSQVLQDQVSCLVDMVHRKGDTACSIMLGLLEELDPHLYGELHL